ncbi:oxidoreductase [compost metagenome]
MNRDTGFGKGVMKLLSHFFLTPEQGADTAVYLATAPELAETTGRYFYRRKVKELTPRAESREEAGRLWEFSLRAVGLAED